MERYGTAGQVTDDSIIRRMRITCRITEATDTYSEYITIIAFSTATMVTRTRSNVEFYVRCLSCYICSRRETTGVYRQYINGLYKPWLISNLMHKIIIYLYIIYLLKSSTCFEHYPAHLQEVYVVTVYMQHLVSSLCKSEFSKITVL